MEFDATLQYIFSPTDAEKKEEMKNVSFFFFLAMLQLYDDAFIECFGGRFWEGTMKTYKLCNVIIIIIITFDFCLTNSEFKILTLVAQKGGVAGAEM